MSTDKRATNLDDAWRNFNPDLPLPGGSPFFVDYERRPLDKFKRALLRSPNEPTRFFLAGFRGSGKSTHLNRLAEDADLTKAFHIVKYNIRDTCDFNNITIVDLIISLAATVINNLPRGLNPTKEPTKGILEELSTWGQTVENTVQAGRGSLLEAKARVKVGLDLPIIASIWAKITSRTRLESSSREIIREIIEPQLSDLIEKLNALAAVIKAHGKPLFVIVDDTDKLRQDFTYALFNVGMPNLASLTFHALYTVREFTFYSSDYPEVKGGSNTADILRNVKLWERGNKSAWDKEGEAHMLDFIHRRMDEEMIAKAAAREAAHLSGGVFRQLASLMQIAIDRAIAEHRSRVEVDDVRFAANEARKGLLRIFTQNHRVALQYVSDTQKYPEGPNLAQSREEVIPLLLLLAILEYENHDTWYDINPVLWNDFAPKAS